MRYSFVSALVLLTTAYAHGQRLEPHSSSAPDAVHPIAITFQVNVSTAGGCPIGMFAERRFDVEMVRVGEPLQKPPAQGLHVTFDHLNAPAIESAEITIYGLAPKLSLVPADVRSNGEVAKTFQLHRGEGSKTLREANLWMSGVGVLERADLNSITYVDGSTWRESEASKCRAVPSALMLIGSR